MNDHTAEVRSSRNLRRGAHQLLELYRGHWGQLFWAAFWFTVKHSPAWVTPIVSSWFHKCAFMVFCKDTN